MRFASPTGHYELVPFPGNQHICVSKSVWIQEKHRGKGHGQEQHIKRLDMAQSLGYTYIICTVRDDNAAELHILGKHGWQALGYDPHGKYWIFGKHLEEE